MLRVMLILHSEMLMLHGQGQITLGTARTVLLYQPTDNCNTWVGPPKMNVMCLSLPSWKCFSACLNYWCTQTSCHCTDINCIQLHCLTHTAWMLSLLWCWLLLEDFEQRRDGVVRNHLHTITMIINLEMFKLLYNSHIKTMIMHRSTHANQVITAHNIRLLCCFLDGTVGG